jgi:hypothetical protein
MLIVQTITFFQLYKSQIILLPQLYIILQLIMFHKMHILDSNNHYKMN